MKEATITVEVHCVQPRWVDKENSHYRIYLNDELMTERTWIWDQDTYIQENILANIEANINHVVRVEVVKTIHGALTQLALQNLFVNGVAFPNPDLSRDTLSFTIG